MIPCVLYGAKSTEDTHGSIPTQLTDCRALAEREGWAIVGEDEDEGFSAYSGNRGPGLERAKEIAVTAAREHGRCVLVAQDADRFARGAGDEPGAVKAGLRRRKEAGLPQGPLPLGYMVEKEIVDGQVITRRVVDPEFSPIMERTFKLIDAGHTAAEIARIFNDEGLRQPARGDGPDRGFNSRQVRARLRNRVYLGGEKNYPRMPWLTDELCSARPKRADVLESAILSRLETFVGDVDDWIRERQEAQQQQHQQLQRVADREHAHLGQIERRVQRAEHHYDEALDADDDARAATALEQLTRLRQERSERLQAVADADSQVQEWTGEPDLDDARRRLENLAKHIKGEIAEAEDAEELRVVLRRAIADISVSEVEDNDDRRHLLISVTLDGHDLPTMLLGGHPDEVREMLPALLGGGP